MLGVWLRRFAWMGEFGSELRLGGGMFVSEIGFRAGCLA